MLCGQACMALYWQASVWSGIMTPSGTAGCQILRHYLPLLRVAAIDTLL